MIMPVIICTKNGPYIVKNMKSLRNSRDEDIPTKEVIALCRCGGSGNKPFCDGTHARIGFSDEKSPDRVPDRKDDYDGQGITIHDNRGICSHAGFCTDGLPSVFKLGREPWIDPYGAEVEEIIRTIKRCPSGALSYSSGGAEHRDQDREPAIKVSKNGPYYVTGWIKLEDVEWAEGASKEHYTLCRCGASKNKPFCSGQHWYVKFKDDKN